MIRTRKNLIKNLRHYLSGEIEIHTINENVAYSIKYIFPYLLDDALDCLKQQNLIKDYERNYQWFTVILNVDMQDGIMPEYQYATCSLIFYETIPYNDLLQRVAFNKCLYPYITNTINNTTVYSAKGATAITISIYGKFIFNKDGECVNYQIKNIDNDLYIFNSYQEFKNENSEIFEAGIFSDEKILQESKV